MSAIEPVTAAGGVVYNDNGEVLLIFRRGVWDLPKGKLEEEESIRECAVREVAEEIGISKLPHITFALDNTCHDYVEYETQYSKTTHWFGMQLAEIPVDGFAPETKEGIERVKWTSLAEAKALVGYSNLVDVLNFFEQIHDQKRS